MMSDWFSVEYCWCSVDMRTYCATREGGAVSVCSVDSAGSMGTGGGLFSIRVSSAFVARPGSPISAQEASCIRSDLFVRSFIETGSVPSRMNLDNLHAARCCVTTDDVQLVFHRMLLVLARHAHILNGARRRDRINTRWFDRSPFHSCQILLSLAVEVRRNQFTWFHRRLVQSRMTFPVCPEIIASKPFT